jgi:hypothetical protein
MTSALRTSSNDRGANEIGGDLVRVEVDSLFGSPGNDVGIASES